MTLQNAIDEYVAWRRHHGAKFHTQAGNLNRFSGHVGKDIHCDAVDSADVLRFLASPGPLTLTRDGKYSTLFGFYRYAISRGHATRSPLPPRDSEPRPPKPALPYVYSRDELVRLFGAIGRVCEHARKLDAHTMRALLLVLYGAGLRFREAQKLTLDDVDLPDAVLTIRDSKFYKSRLVPIGPQLVDALGTYAVRRAERPLPDGRASTFLAYLDGTPLRGAGTRLAFTKVLREAGIHHDRDGVWQTPRMHALRHTAAVHRLISWYRQGADVQRLLPALSTWLGHTHLRHTQVYLSMTPDLLHKASVRFDHHVNGGSDE